MVLVRYLANKAIVAYTFKEIGFFYTLLIAFYKRLGISKKL